MTGDEKPSRRPGSIAIRSAVAGLILALVAGVVLRVLVFGHSLVGDELSTLWIVKGRSLPEVTSLVHGDAEISPPLFFLLAWLAEKASSSPEAIRLPSLLAGLGFLPMIWLLAREAVDRRAAGVAVAVASIAPILVYFSGNGRGYAVMLFFALASTWCLLRADRSGRWPWWAAYAALVALAMYSHYTAAFYLAGQFLWLLVARPDSRLSGALATAAAAVLYLPWIGGYLADADSPTTPILEALQGHGFEAKRIAVEQLLFWEVTGDEWSIGGRLDVWLIVAGIGMLLAGLLIAARGSGRPRLTDRQWLMVILLLAPPVGAALFALVGTDTFGGRNLAPTWIGLSILIGLAVVRVPRTCGFPAAALILAGLLVGSVHLTDPTRSEFRYADAAGFIDDQAGAGDRIVDASHITPAPLTPLDAYLESDLPEYRLNLPQTAPPYLPGTDVPDSRAQLAAAFKARDQVFVATLIGERELLEGRLFIDGGYLPIPPGWRVARQEVFAGIYPIAVTVFERTGMKAPE